MPFLGTMPPVSGQANLQASDSSPKMTVGAMLLYTDANGNLSWVRYAKADNATVKQHLAVKHALLDQELRPFEIAVAGEQGVIKIK